MRSNTWCKDRSRLPWWMVLQAIVQTAPSAQRTRIRCRKCNQLWWQCSLKRSFPNNMKHCVFNLANSKMCTHAIRYGVHLPSSAVVSWDAPLLPQANVVQTSNCSKYLKRKAKITYKYIVVATVAPLQQNGKQAVLYVYVHTWLQDNSGFSARQWVGHFGKIMVHVSASRRKAPDGSRYVSEVTNVQEGNVRLDMSSLMLWWCLLGRLQLYIT